MQFNFVAEMEQTFINLKVVFQDYFNKCIMHSKLLENILKIRRRKRETNQYSADDLDLMKDKTKLIY